MKLASVLVAALATGCGSSPPPTAPTNATPVTELRCKTAVEAAAEHVHMRARDVTMGIGECEQQDWARGLRECVQSAKDETALSSCGTQYKVTDRHSMLAEHASFAKAMKAMRHFKDEMCACADTKCAQVVSDEMTKWSQEEAKSMSEPPKMSEEDTKEAVKIGEAMGQCMQKAMSSGMTP